MKKNTNWYSKLVICIMTLSLISPIFLSTGVSAAESRNQSDEIIEDVKKNGGNHEESLSTESKEVVEFDDSEGESSDSTLDSDGVSKEKSDKSNSDQSKDLTDETIEVEQSSNSSETSENVHNTDSANDQKQELSPENDHTTDAESENKAEATNEVENEDKEEEVNEPEDYYSPEEIREKAMQMLEDNQKQSPSTFSLMSASTDPQSFINAISDYAISVADEYGLYASVMIAQAGLESAWGSSILAYAPNYNLFGIKGEYNGQSFSKYSKEYSDENGWQFIKSDFKKYPTYKESFIDYAKKLKNGPDWDRKQGSWSPNYYKGTWRENTKSYKDATQALVGKYATDPDYASKLNNIIETYNLTQYDVSKNQTPEKEENLEENILHYDKVLSEKVNNYAAKITTATDGIYTKPKGTVGSEVVASTTQYDGQEARISKEAVTNNATWAFITVNGKELGWIDKRGLDIETVTATKNIQYAAKISRSTDGINTKPFGVEGFETKMLSSEILGKEVRIIKEATTRRATWALITLNGKELGWIDKRGLDIETVTATKNIQYAAKISRSTDGINTKPFGVEGFETKMLSSEILGKEVRIIKEATTRRATWALITLNGKELGWIDKRGLDIETVTATKNIQYAAKISRSTDGINTKPFGVEGFETKMLSSEILGKEVRIIKEATTRRATWALITLNGKELGWIDKRGLDIETVTATKNIQYAAKISRSTDGINTKPFGVEGFETKMLSSEILGKEVRIIKEATTRRATWALITLNGKELGWIDKRGLDIETVTATKNIQYAAKISRSTDGINTKPFGVEGFETKMLSSEILGKEVRIIKEATTRRATWALITLNGKELGWIDKRGLDIETVTSTKNVNYNAVVNRSTDGINTKPFGVEGYETKYMSSEYLGKNIKVTKEATTRRATWALITLNGKELGWIDKAGLKTAPIIVIDAGHGGSDSGASSGGVYEDELNLSVAIKVQQRLEKSGFVVIMTRTTDTFLELSERAAIANKNNADIFVSIHTNAFNGIANGIETYSYNRNGNAKNPIVANDPNRNLKSTLLSNSIQNSLISSTGAYNRGAKQANFHVVRETAMPAVLVEMGFIDNVSERAKLRTDNYQNKIADGIVEGIRSYFSTVK